VGGGGVQQIQLRTEGRENGYLGAAASLVRGFGGSCNLVQDISFHIKIFLIFCSLRLFMKTTMFFVIANVKQLRTDGSFRTLLPFSEHLGVLAS